MVHKADSQIEQVSYDSLEFLPVVVDAVVFGCTLNECRGDEQGSKLFWRAEVILFFAHD
jgi:hypothetical protein